MANATPAGSLPSAQDSSIHVKGEAPQGPLAESSSRLGRILRWLVVPFSPQGAARMDRTGRAVYRRRDRNVRARNYVDPSVGDGTARDEVANVSDIPESSEAAAQRSRRSVFQRVQQLPRGTMTIDEEGTAHSTDTDDDDEVEDENYRINPHDAGDEEDEAVLGSLVGRLRPSAQQQQTIARQERPRVKYSYARERDSSLFAVLKSIFCMCKRTDERTHKERQGRKKTTEMVKKNRRDIKEMRRLVGQEVSPDGSELQSKAESSPEQVTDFETLKLRGVQHLRSSFCQAMAWEVSSLYLDLGQVVTTLQASRFQRHTFSSSNSLDPMLTPLTLSFQGHSLLTHRTQDLSSSLVPS
ncbi:unnamed protein product [Miscanthus lutarioriparius]|uniref:Uncharacterized protein n=1 Tax=Miscanthus lutarioriparius TaxID=422564 RepID=A0A811S778_9POAL|nr:unnamed protein product [Miscanthus lutarioriparius]